MKNIKILLIYLAITASIYGQNIMSIPDIVGESGDTVEVSIDIANSESFVAFQTDVILPTQVEYIVNSASLTSRSNGHSISANLVDPQTLRLIAFSVSQNQFFGNSGSVLSFKVKLKSIPDFYNLELINPIISNSSSQNILTSFTNGQLNLIAPDISVSTSSLDFGEIPLGQYSDRSVYIQNNGNKTLIINRIYTNNQYFVIQGDTSLSLNPGVGQSLNLRFNSIAKGNYANKLFILSDDPDESNVSIDLSAYAFAVNELHGLSASGRSGYKITIPFKINNMEEFVGFQFDLLLPNVLSYVNGSARLSDRKVDHQVSANYISSNRLRVVSFSVNNQSFGNNDGEILYLDFMLNGNGGNYSYNLDSVLITNSNAENILSDFYSSYINIASPDIDGSLSINMGEVSATDTASYNYRIYNYGNDTLKISSAVFNNNSFYTDVNFPIIITQGNYYDLPLFFSNPQKGNYNGKLTIRSNDPDEDPFIVNLSAISFAPNYLKVENINAVVGDTVKLYLSIDNYENFVAFQTDLTFPSNMTYINNSAKLTSRANGHTISVGNNGTNSLRIITFSLNQNNFIGVSGNVAELSFLTSAPIGSYDLLLNNSIISNQASENIIKSSINGTAVIERLATPLLLSPSNEALGLLAPITLRWKEVIKASSYKLEVSKDNSFVSPIVTESSLTDTIYVIENLEDLTSYYWRVKGINLGGESDWSVVRSFRTLGLPTTVSLLSPENNSINQSIEQRFIWSRAQDRLRGISKYWFELSIDTTKVSYLIDSTLTDTIKTVNALNYLTDYYWRVKSKNEVGWSGFTQWNKFTTIIENPSEVLLVSPNDNAINQPIELELRWNGVTGSEKYYVEVSRDNVFSDIVKRDSTLQTSYTLSGLEYLREYYWRVRGRNIGGYGSWSEIRKFTTIIERPEVVELVSPIDGSLGNIKPVTILWKSSNRSSSYKLELSKDNSFTSVIVTESSLTDTSYVLNNLEDLTSYYWRVKGINLGGESDWSEVMSFRTLGLPTTVSLLSPENNSINQSIEQRFIWSRAQDRLRGISKYWFELSIDTTKVSYLIDSTLTDTIKTVNALNYLTDYYWRVKSKNEVGWSGFTQWNKFTTIIENPSEVLLVSPNNNAIGLFNPITLKWKKSDRSENYILQLSKNIAFINSIIDTTLFSDTTLTIENLEISTKYYWRVKASNTGGDTEWSASWSFTTLSPPKSVKLLLPENNSVNQSINQSFTWQRLKDEIGFVDKYMFQLNKDTNNNFIIYDSTITDTVKIVNNLENSTDYFWKVKGKNKAGWGQFSQWNKFSTIVDNPNIPLLIQPLNNGINQTINLSLKWGSVNGTDKYFIELSKSIDFSSLILSDSTDLTVYQVINLDYLTKYYWRIRAKNIGGFGEWSEIWNFTTIIEKPMAVDLESPSNASLGNIKPVTIKWKQSERAATYNLQLSTDNSFITSLVDTTLLTDTSMVLNNLQDLTTYYWRVKAVNICGESVWSETWSFRTIGVPTVVSLLQPNNGSANQAINQTFIWTKANDQLRIASPERITKQGRGKGTNDIQTVGNYWFELSTDTTKSSYIIDSTITDTTKAVNGLSYLTDYYWRVKSKNKAGWSEFTSWNKFTTIIDNPSVPLLISPNNRSINQPVLVELKWGEVGDTEYYNIEISKDSTFTTTLKSDTTIQINYNIGGLEYLTSYFWRVRAKNIGGYSEWSEVWRFTTIIEKPSVVELLSPVTNSIGIIKPIKLNWKKSERASSYKLQISKDDTFTSIVIDYESIADTIKEINDLENLTTYYWRVKAVNIGGESDWSETWSFRTLGEPTVVSLLAPINNAVNQPLSVNFLWSKANDQLRIASPEKITKQGRGKGTNDIQTVGNYWFELSTDTTKISYIIDTTLVDTTKSVTGLSYLTKYYWRVKSKNEAGWSEFTTWNKFTTIIEKPAIVNLSTPLNGSLGIIKPVTIKWEQADRAATYNLQLSTDHSFTTSLVDTTLLTDTSFVLNNLQDLTTYYWRVKAVNVGGESDWSETWSFRTIGVPTIVSLLQPENSSVNQSINQTFIWTKANDQFRVPSPEKIIKKGNLIGSKGTNDIQTVGNYWFELSTDTTKAPYLIDTTLIDTTKTVNNLSYLTEYYWRVKSKNEAGWSEFTSWNKFTTIIEKPSVVQLVSPSNNAVGLLNPIKLKWKNSARSETYSLQLSKTNDFSSAVIDTNLLSDTTITVNNLEIYASYYWRVKAVNVGGESSWSEIWKFTTLGEPLAVELIYPENNAIDQLTDITFIWSKGEEKLKSNSPSKGITKGKSKGKNEIQSIGNYWFELSTDTTQVSYIIDTTLVDTTKTVNGLEYVSNYFWRVKSKNEIGWGEFSNWNKFTTKNEIPEAVSLLYPINGVEEAEIPTKLIWKKQARAEKYELQIAKDAQFSEIVLSQNDLIDTTKIFTSEYLTQYYWRVRGINEVGNGSWSSVWQFTTKDNPIITQTIYLPSGWSMISSYLNPTNANLDSILLSIKNNLKIMKNGAGKVYMPEFQLNSIGDWKIEEGYKIYMTAADSLKINGLMINKEENPIILQSGWNLFAYYSDQVQDLETAFSTIKENIVIIKNGAGKVYIPSFGINTIGNLIPGEGYQGYMSALDTLYYKNITVSNPIFAKAVYNSSSSTGSNATLILTGDFENETTINAKTISGKNIGSGKFIDGIAVIDLIGDNTITEDIIEGAIENEGIELTIHNTNRNSEIAVKFDIVENLLTNSFSNKLEYKSDALLLINNIEKAPEVFELIQNYPNPFNPTTIISYSLAENTLVKLRIYDALGSLVSELLNTNQEAGSYKMEFNASNLSSGIYFYRLELKNQTFTKKMMLIK